MPIGIFTDVTATLCGALLGCILSARLGDSWKKLLHNLLGIAAIVMGIVLIIRAKNLSAVILALLLGAVVGELLRLEDRINGAATALTARLMGGGADEAYLVQVSAALILFCCGGTGWFGALNEGLTGDGSILVTRPSWTASPPASSPPCWAGSSPACASPSCASIWPCSGRPIWCRGPSPTP